MGNFIKHVYVYSVTHFNSHIRIGEFKDPVDIGAIWQDFITIKGRELL